MQAEGGAARQLAVAVTHVHPRVVAERRSEMRDEGGPAADPTGVL